MTNTTNTTADIGSYSMGNMPFFATHLGAIRLGHTVGLPGAEVRPVADDEFKVTQPLRDGEGNWLRDPLDAKLRQGLTAEGSGARKLREIPIRVHVNDPSLVVRSRLEAFDVGTKRSVCVSEGDGTAKRVDGGTGYTQVACVGCDRCQFALSGQVECKFFGRIAVQIEGQGSDLGTYVLRSTSIHGMRSFEAKLRQYWALFGKKLRGAPLKMILRSASSELSNWKRFFFVDLELVDGIGLEQAMASVKAQAEKDLASGLDYSALEAVMAQGLSFGMGADLVEDGLELGEFSNAGKYAATVSAVSAIAPAADFVGEDVPEFPSTRAPVVAGSTEGIFVPGIRITPAPVANAASAIVSVVAPDVVATNEVFLMDSKLVKSVQPDF